MRQTGFQIQKCKVRGGHFRERLPSAPPSSNLKRDERRNVQWCESLLSLRGMCFKERRVILQLSPFCKILETPQCFVGRVDAEIIQAKRRPDVEAAICGPQ